jgi:hypothetical protein
MLQVVGYTALYDTTIFKETGLFLTDSIILTKVVIFNYWKNEVNFGK